MALAVFASGVVLAVAPAADSRYSDVGTVMRPSTLMVVAVPTSSGELERTFQGVPGVRSVIPLSSVSSAPGAPGRFTAWIADCAELRLALTRPFPGCSAATGYRNTKAPSWLRPGGTVPVVLEGWSQNKTFNAHLPDDFVTADIGQPDSPYGTDLILPPDSVSRSARRHLHAYTTLIRTDGTAATVERVRNAVAEFDRGWEVRTLDQVVAQHRHISMQVASLVDLGLMVALGIALANLVVVTVDHVHERRRAVGVLAASGVPLRTLSGSVAVEAGLAMVPGIAGAAVLAAVVAWIFGAIIEQHLSFPTGRVALLSMLTFAAVGLVTVCTLPALRGAARPETLQDE